MTSNSGVVQVAFAGILLYNYALVRQCPTCGTTYTDETLRFCLADGAPLSDLGGEQPTVVRQSGGGSSTDKTVAMGGGLRVDIPQEAPPQPHYHAAAPPASSGGTSGLLKILLVILGLGFLIVLLALVVMLVYYNTGPEKGSGNDVNVKAPSASPSPTKDGNDELRDQIANLQKQLAEQKNANQPSNTTVPTMPSSTTTARVNSPGDGFLALRTLPSSEAGDRITKIPHGATVSIGACGPVVRPVSKSGRWCQARFNGLSGYVFDAYLVY